MAIIPRHADLGDTALNDLEKRCFEGWLAENKKVVDFKTVTKEEFNIPLRQFYGNVGNGKGEKYSRSSYLVLQSGLNRFLNDPPIGRSWCLMKDTEFTILNHVFMGNIKQLRRQGKDITNSHPPISNKEMAHLQNSQALNPGTPRGLVQKVWFHLQLHLGRRGKEGNRQLKPNSFLIKTDKNGLRYATLAYNEATKNHLDPRERGRESKTGFMFEQPGNPLCPVASLEKYQSKCPENALAFYLHSRRGECIGDSIWYTLEPMGVNYLAALLPKICRATGSTTYTNHSIRTTTVQKLANADLEAREIMSCVGTSDNMVKTLFPMLNTAVEKENPIEAVRIPEKAKRWIHDIIKEVDQMVDKYNKLNRGVGSVTSDVTSTKAETEDKKKKLNKEEECLQERVDTLTDLPDPVHLAEVQRSLTRIQHILLQLKSFWENIGVMVTNLQQRTFAGEDLIEFLSDFKDEFLASLDTTEKCGAMSISRCGERQTSEDRPFIHRDDEPPFAAGSSCEEGEPEESEPSTSTDDDSSLGGQEEYVSCVDTSDNMVKTLFPMLKTAVEKEKALLAVRLLEKAKRWINDIIKEVDQIVKK
ncbi:hypothetical protein J4Q44_G00306190 [Coregonus suidteri]|uniref:ZMYM2-like/QRICH1 C-terminal domain-containing protein n=1 Tax=Coregonus suidteri TaxID=861788 RepID=A0AAN8KQG7_9TELE